MCECLLFARKRSSAVARTRSAHRRIADARGRMSVHRRIPDVAERGAEGRLMTQLGHSTYSRFLPLDPSTQEG